ncbi:hypothetical protein HZB88_02670 [archaeon]|nr:hypothetical protein [archaeon]
MKWKIEDLFFVLGFVSILIGFPHLLRIDFSEVPVSVPVFIPLSQLVGNLLIMTGLVLLCWRNGRKFADLKEKQEEVKTVISNLEKRYLRGSRIDLLPEIKKLEAIVGDEEES